MWLLEQLLFMALVLPGPASSSVAAVKAEVHTDNLPLEASESIEEYCRQAAESSIEQCSYDAAQKGLPIMFDKDVCGQHVIHTHGALGRCHLNRSQTNPAHACKELLQIEQAEPWRHEGRTPTSHRCAVISDGHWQKTTEGLRFTPDTDCMYQTFSREDALQCLRRTKTRIVIAGDSMWRQLHLRFLYFVRNSALMLDHACHLNARYSVCETGDFITHSNIPEKEDEPGWETRLSTLFSGHSAIASACKTHPTEIHYVWAPLFDRQVSRIPRYLELFPEQASEKLILVMGSPGYWTQDRKTMPPDYLDMLKAISQRVSQVFVMGVPTLNVPIEEKQRNLQLRNEQLSQWVKTSSNNKVHFFDYDRFARADGAPKNLMFNDWHYMCHWDFMGCSSNHSIVPTQDCNCQDDMNLAIWQGLLNSICRK